MSLYSVDRVPAAFDISWYFWQTPGNWPQSKKGKSDRAWWLTPLVPALWEVGAGRFRSSRQPSLHRETLSPKKQKQKTKGGKSLIPPQPLAAQSLPFQPCGIGEIPTSVAIICSVLKMSASGLWTGEVTEERHLPPSLTTGSGFPSCLLTPQACTHECAHNKY